MMAVWVGHSPKSPAVALAYGIDFFSSSADGLGAGGVGIGDGEDHFRGTAAESFRTEVEMLRGLVAEPEFGAIDRESRHDISIGVFDVVDLDGGEGGFVKLDGLRAFAYGQPRGQRGTYCFCQ